MFSVIHKGLLCICLYHWVSYRRNCKGGEWWWKSYCSLFCNFHQKLITYLWGTRCPIILTAKLNFNKIFVNSVGIQKAKAKLEKKFDIISLENLLLHICSHCCTCWTARTWPYKPCHFKLLLRVFVEVDLDFADPFEFNNWLSNSLSGMSLSSFYLSTSWCCSSWSESDSGHQISLRQGDLYGFKILIL